MNIFPTSVGGDYSQNIQAIRQRAAAEVTQRMPATQQNQKTENSAVLDHELKGHQLKETQQLVLSQKIQGKQHVTSQNQNAQNDALNPMVKEVANIAEKSGFVGLSTQDVLRAYAYGTSLLADYSV